jgi:hypothetical protein
MRKIKAKLIFKLQLLVKKEFHLLEDQLAGQYSNLAHLMGVQRVYLPWLAPLQEEEQQGWRQLGRLKLQMKQKAPPKDASEKV